MKTSTSVPNLYSKSRFILCKLVAGWGTIFNGNDVNAVRVGVGVGDDWGWKIWSLSQFSTQPSMQMCSIHSTLDSYIFFSFHSPILPLWLLPIGVTHWTWTSRSQLFNHSRKYTGSRFGTYPGSKNMIPFNGWYLKWATLRITQGYKSTATYQITATY